MNAPLRLPSACSRARTVVLCGSMSHFGYMCQVHDELAGDAVPAALPDPEGHEVAVLAQEQYRQFVARATITHLRRVRSSTTFAILVANFDKHGIDDYIGPSTFAEIAAAASHNKRIFILNDFPTAYRDLLGAWRAVPLHGRLDGLVQAHREWCGGEREILQLGLQV